jgi:hypothetical protein
LKYVKIYGERNTNTNYLGEIIRLNLDVAVIPGVVPKRMRKMQARLPAKNRMRDLYFQLTFSRNLGWKHSRVKSAEELQRYALVRSGAVGFITITKNPYSWLQSFFKRPYHQGYEPKHARPEFDAFLELPCSTVGRENLEGGPYNPVQLWNVKNQAYLQLSELNAINLTAEQILENPPGVIAEISRTFGLGYRSDTFINFDESTKYESKDSNYYRDYYTNERWKDSLSASSIEIINRQLDPALMERFGYSFI